MEKFLLSIIIPVFNEEKNISPLLDRLTPIVNAYDYEIIFVSDGSTDHTGEEVKKYASTNNRIKYVEFYRNFGHQMALTCGYRYAKGNCVITIDADLQDPPEIIQEMVEKERLIPTLKSKQLHFFMLSLISYQRLQFLEKWATIDY